MKTKNPRTMALRQLVRQHHLSHAELAEILGCAESNARALTCGTWPPSKRLLRLLELELAKRQPAQG